MDPSDTLAATTFDPLCDPRRLAMIGAHVRQRLAHVPAAERQATDLAEVYLFRRFLSPSDCKRIVQVVNTLAAPSTLAAGHRNEGFRTSHTHHFERGNPYTSDLEHYICDITGLDVLHAERMQGQRYQKGQEYRHHVDWFPLGTNFWDIEKQRGGQRTWTAMINLNEPHEGGETDFPQLWPAFQAAQRADAGVDNMTPDGRPNNKTLHAGMPVLRGIKHVITLWFRQEPYRVIDS